MMSSEINQDCLLSALNKFSFKEVTTTPVISTEAITEIVNKTALQILVVIATRNELPEASPALEEVALIKLQEMYSSEEIFRIINTVTEIEREVLGYLIYLLKANQYFNLEHINPIE